MRPIFAAATVLVILGGLYLYMSMRSPMRVPPPPVERTAPGVYWMDVTLALRAEPEDFSLEDEPTLVVRFGVQELLEKKGIVEPGVPLVIKPISQVVIGHDKFSGSNEFYVMAMTGSDLNRAQVVRVRLFRDEDLVSEKTMWSDPGQPVEGILRIEVVDSTASESDHEHEGE